MVPGASAQQQGSEDDSCSIVAPTEQNINKSAAIEIKAEGVGPRARASKHAQYLGAALPALAADLL